MFDGSIGGDEVDVPGGAISCQFTSSCTVICDLRG
jgi:hypothetical protein